MVWVVGLRDTRGTREGRRFLSEKVGSYIYIFGDTLPRIERIVLVTVQKIAAKEVDEFLGELCIFILQQILYRKSGIC